MQSRNILVVDDQPDLRMELSRFIARLGQNEDGLVKQAKDKLAGVKLLPQAQKMEFHVETAESGEDALDKCRAAKSNGKDFSVIFLDMRMPGGWDGLTTMKHLWTEDPRLQVVMCTAYSDLRWEELLKEVGHRDNLFILKKPFEGEELAQTALALSEKYLNEQMLVRYNSCLVGMLESLPYMLILLDRTGHILYWNKEAGELCGIDAEDAIGRKLAEKVFFPNDCLELINSRLAGGRELRGHIFRSHHQGEERAFRLFLYQLESPMTEAAAMLQIEDISDNIRKDEYLRQSQKMETVGNLVSGLAHDFNNVIGSIGATLDSLVFSLEESSGTEALTEEIRPDLETMEAAVARGSEMVEQLLSLSRNREEISLTELDLNQLITDSFQLCRKSLDPGIAPEIVTQPMPAIILGDRGMLTQVFINLMINASHAMTIMRTDGDPKGGKLLISLTCIEVGENIISVMPDIESGEYWVVTISDTGVGMDETTKAKIFDPFFSTKADGKGSGLGLSMVYYIIRQHKGFIQVDSTPGKETTFFLFFPRMNGHSEKTQP